MLKLLQEIRGFAAMRSRSPAPRLPELMPAQMRSHVIRATLPKRRLIVQMEPQDLAGTAHPVKINHVTQQLAARASLPAS
jgi:hypothetical protein